MDTFDVFTKMPEEPLGWLETKLPNSVMERLQNYIESAKKNPVNHNWNLAGNITKSLLMEDKDDWFFKNTLVPLINGLHEMFPQFKVNFLSEDAVYCMPSFWVNFQKENEFNPLHDHGGIFSFVIWVKIPTDWREQHALPISANSNSPKASDFEFRYSTMVGDIGHYAYHLDKEAEGMMLYFPAKLIHIVYPFYNCDEERISISGNILLDISENSMRQFRSQQKGKDD